ncbi:MAG: aldo/keto reductase [Phycisphaerae bacterium]|jgi:predicted aldo/keto reductase-like oxidoreductase|nr:aldo/keto reductase [Phycisphaerae bacterium]
MKRREFIKASTFGATAVAIGETSTLAADAKVADFPKRTYGKDGPKLSIIGFPGLVLRKLEQKPANELVAEAFERGINYFDVAPAYGDAEIKLGPALEPYRKKVFLACKTKMRDAAGAKTEFERSLKRLRTDRFDLYQLHVLSDVRKDVKAAFAKGGAMEYLIAQQKAGRIRYLGFSAHTEEAALAAMELFKFDSILFPINFASWLKADFGPKVVKKAKSVGATVLGIKTFARRRWNRGDPGRKRFGTWYEPTHDRTEADLALRFAMSRGLTATVPPASVEIHKLALDIAPGVRAVTPAETAKLKALAQTLTPLFPHKPRT